MSDISPERINIQVEETSYRSAVSEATLTRMGASVNHINMKQYDSIQFSFNGRYFGKGAPQINVDGSFSFLFDVEIMGVDLFNMVQGTSGDLEVDILRQTASNQVGTTIFTTKPKINYTAGFNVHVFKRFGDFPLILQNPSGTTVPVLSTTFLNAGDSITCNITAVQQGAENGGVRIYFRPMS